MSNKFLTGSLEVNKGTLAGTISGKCVIDGTVSGKNELSGSVFIDGGREAYNGDYVVIPKATEQLLSTAGKVMVDDVTVKEIPYTEVSNPAGGVTVIIA